MEVERVWSGWGGKEVERVRGGGGGGGWRGEGGVYLGLHSQTL